MKPSEAERHSLMLLTVLVVGSIGVNLVATGYPFGFQSSGLWQEGAQEQWNYYGYTFPSGCYEIFGYSILCVLAFAVVHPAAALIAAAGLTFFNCLPWIIVFLNNLSWEHWQGAGRAFAGLGYTFLSVIAPLSLFSLLGAVISWFVSEIAGTSNPISTQVSKSYSTTVNKTSEGAAKATAGKAAGKAKSSAKKVVSYARKKYVGVA